MNKKSKEQHLFKNEIFCNIRHVLMSPLITLMHPYWKKFWLTNKFLCCVHFVLCASVHSVGYYLLQYKHCQSDQQGISSFTSRRRSNFLLLCLLRALSRSLSYFVVVSSLQQLFYRKYCITRCWHRAWRNVPTLLIDRLFHIFKVYCVCACISLSMCASLCVCSRLI